MELSSRAGILESRRNNQTETARVAICRGSTDPVLICGKSHAVLRGTSPHYGGRSKWAYSNLGSGVYARATPFCPFLAKTGGSRWDFIAIYFVFFQYEHTDGLYESQYRRLFTSTTAGRNGWESFSPGNTEFSLQPHPNATASPPTAECTAVSHPAMQPHLLGTIALHCARVNSNGSNALT